MDFRFTPEEEAFRQEVRDFLRRELPPGYQGPMWLDGFFASDEMWALFKTMARKMGERGWLSATWPRAYGGQEASATKILILTEELFYHRAPGLDIFGVKMLSPVLLQFGNEEQKQRHLPPIARGEVFWSQGYSEPNAGSDLAGLQTRAVEADGHFLVSGQKIWTSGAHRADWIFLLCRTDPQVPKHQGISFLLVDLRSPGVEVRPLLNILGGRGFNEIFFDNVRVPKENLVGGRGGGWQIATALLSFERSGVERVGGARRFLEELVTYLGQKPLSPELRQRLAQAAVEVEVGKLLAYRVGWLQSQHLPAPSEAAMAKLYLSEMVQRLANLGAQVLGLYAQVDPPVAPLHGVQDLYLGTLGASIAGGTSEVQRLIMATRGLGLPRG